MPRPPKPADGGIPVSLGPRILRTETAAIVAPALVLHVLGQTPS